MKQVLNIIKQLCLPLFRVKCDFLFGIFPHFIVSVSKLFIGLKFFNNENLFNNKSSI